MQGYSNDFYYIVVEFEIFCDFEVSFTYIEVIEFKCN